MTCASEGEELNLSATQGGKTRLERLRKHLARYVEKWTPPPAELAEVCLAVDDDDDEWMTEVVDRVHSALKQGVEESMEEFLKGEMESTDLQGNLEEIDALEAEAKDEPHKEAWRPSRIVEDDVQVYRMKEKQMHLLELQKELSAREDAVDETLGRLRRVEDRVTKLRKEAEARISNTEEEIGKIVDSIGGGGAEVGGEGGGEEVGGGERI